MPYEIPQDLQYEEKVFFNLSFSQLVWLAVFGGAAALIYFKLQLPFVVKLPAAVILLVLGVGFAFLNFWSHFTTLNNYRASISSVGYFDKKLFDFVEVKEIKGNAIYLTDGSARGILQVKPVNFSILGKARQQAIISAYLDFLNSLDFPIQIVMRTVDLSLKDYLSKAGEKVRKLGKEELINQFTSFQKFVEEFIEEKKVKNRLFYVAVPAESTAIGFKEFFERLNKKNREENPLHQLDVRIKLCQEKLEKSGLKTTRLNNQQLLALLSTFFNSFLEAENNYFYPLTVKALNKFQELKTGGIK